MGGPAAIEPLSPVLAPWSGFYSLLGEASATMIGLLFVAASVGSGIFSQDRRGPLRMFLSASVVQFGSTLLACLAVLAPLQRWDLLGGIVLAGGTFGIAYSGLAWRDTVRDGLSASIDLEDRLWYAVAPVLGYLLEAVAGAALILRRHFGCLALAVASGMLLMIAIHNAWDITVWSVTRRQKAAKKEAD